MLKITYKKYANVVIHSSIINFTFSSGQALKDCTRIKMIDVSLFTVQTTDLVNEYLVIISFKGIVFVDVIIKQNAV